MLMAFLLKKCYQKNAYVIFIEKVLSKTHYLEKSVFDNTFYHKNAYGILKFLFCFLLYLE
jgi:hypothetical protein